MSAIELVQEREALGRSKGGFSTKIHLRCEGNGLPRRNPVTTWHILYMDGLLLGWDVCVVFWLCHVVMECCNPLTFLITVGERHEAVVFESLMQQGSVKRSASGRPRLRPRRVVGDKGYSSGKIRLDLRRRGIRLTIPRKSNERRRGKFDKSVYRQRNRVERCFNRLKQFRRIATRSEKNAENYLSMLILASILLWL